MIRFNRMVLTTERIDCTLDEFMDNYYAEAHIDQLNGDILLIYTNSYIRGNLQYIFEVPMIKGMDINCNDNVKRMIRANERKGVVNNEEA